MRHYELVLIVNITQGDRLSSLCQRHRSLVEKHQGAVHRFENWGRRQLCYPIKGCDNAVYLLYNIEVPTACADEMEHQFRINDSVLRYMLVRRDEAVTEKSVIMTETEVAQKAQGEKSHGGGHSRRGSTGERKSAAPAIADEVKSTDSQSPASKAQISADAPATPTAPTPPTPPTPTAPAPTADVAATPESNASGGNAG
ncbi:MAG: 30S ribosomal protein S6 [Gammaproteobacteria bacterium]|nr:30S ribosomal protein S6 [Gammaproteobacteria bacterium]